VSAPPRPDFFLRAGLFRSPDIFALLFLFCSNRLVLSLKF